MSFQIFDEGRGLRLVLSGFTAPLEWAEAGKVLFAHPNRPAHLYHILDFSQADSNSLFALTDAMAVAYAERSRALFGDLPTPFLTAEVSPHDKMQEIFAAFIAARPRPDGHEMARFRTLPHARTWIEDRIAARAARVTGACA